MGKFNLKKLQTRTASAVILGPVTLYIIWQGGLLFIGFVLLAIALSLFEWRKMALKLDRSALFMVIGVLYILVCCGSFYLLRAHFPFQATVFFILMVWASDIGAYFTGKFIGGPRMAASISPNKTWAGLLGATMAPALLSVIWATTYDWSAESLMSQMTIYGFAFLVGVATGLVGQGGDLLISMMKRKSGVKDTGNLIPGHGGLLDRIDALLPNAPLFLLVAFAVSHAG